MKELSYTLKMNLKKIRKPILIKQKHVLKEKKNSCNFEKKSNFG